MENVTLNIIYLNNEKVCHRTCIVSSLDYSFLPLEYDLILDKMGECIICIIPPIEVINRKTPIWVNDKMPEFNFNNQRLTVKEFLKSCVGIEVAFRKGKFSHIVSLDLGGPND